MKKITGLLLLVGVGVFAEQVAELNTETAYSVEQIADEGSIGTLYEEFVFTYMPIIPPAPSEMFLQPVGRLIVFDESTFKRRFLSNLIGEMHPVSGAPVYTVFAMMDASNFDVVLFNENLLELARISRPKTYRPFLWAETKFGAALTPELMALYNPARMIAEYKLIPVDYADYHIAAMERQAALEAATVSMATASPVESDGVSIRMAMAPTTIALTENEESLMVMAMASSPPPPDGGTNSPPAGSGGGSSNLVMELAITMPLDCGPYAEIFQKQNLIYPQLWNVAVNKMAVTGGVETIWADPASSNAATMFYIVGDTSAGIDDGDGYSENRERYCEGSDPLVFDMRDTDGDGMHDWHEIMIFGDLSQTGSGDFDGDGLANDQEMILHSNSVEVICNPSEFDTDGDGTDDGTEVAQGGDPSDPSDGGQPPEPPETTIVTFFLRNKSTYYETDLTMTLSDGTSTYEMTSTGTELNSNAFPVVKGRSYQLALVQNSCPPYTEGYFADISGAGVVVDDPDGILGDHDLNTSLFGTVNTAAVHVMKMDFEEQDGMINYGFDPTGTEPWASVVADSQNPVAQLKVAPVFPGMSIDLVPQDETVAEADPELCTTAQTPFTLDGLAEGETVLEAKIDDVKVGKLNVHVFGQQNLSVGIYRIYDSRSHSATNISAPSDTIIETTLNEVYQQCGIAFSVSDHGALDIAYDDNLDGICQDSEKNILGQYAWEDDILILVFKTSGIPYGDGTGNMVRGIAFGDYEVYPRGAIYFSDNIPADDDFALITAHEAGHNLNLDHDEGDYPAGTKPLMMSGAESGGVLPTAPGRWMRQEDWREANTKAGGM